MAKLVSQTYGEALFELANEQDKIDVFTYDIDLLCKDINLILLICQKSGLLQINESSKNR